MNAIATPIREHAAAIATSLRALPDVTHAPDPPVIYKALSEVTAANKDLALIRPAIDRVARALNTEVCVGVPADHVKFALGVHGAATAAVLAVARSRLEPAGVA